MRYKFPFAVGKPVLACTVLLLGMIACSLTTINAPMHKESTSTPSTTTLNTVTPLPVRTATTTDLPTQVASPIPSLTPFPAEIESLLLDRCNKPWEGVFGNKIFYGLTERYGGKGCKLPVFSPAKEYLAYVTLDQQDNQGSWKDTVKFVQVDKGIDHTVLFAGETNYISDIEWSPADHLIVLEKVWEGPLVVYVYALETKTIVSTIRLDWNGHIKWNAGKTAFYASYSSDYGSGICVRELGGYDFAAKTGFPGLKEKLWAQQKDEMPDDLKIEPFTWSKDGKRLWLTVMPLKALEGEVTYYEVGPSLALYLDFSTTPAEVVVLGSDSKLDFSFTNPDNPEIISSPYQIELCPSE